MSTIGTSHCCSACNSTALRLVAPESTIASTRRACSNCRYSPSRSNSPSVLQISAAIDTEAFWDLVGRCLTKDGRVFFIDSLDVQSTTFDHRENRAGEVTVTRELNDGRRFRIFKLFYAPDELTQRLAALGWKARLSCTPRYFLYGDVSRALAE